MTLLDEIRVRDERYGDHLPDHYQAQLDRRNLLAIIDSLKELTPYVDGGVIAWDLVEKALILDESPHP